MHNEHYKVSNTAHFDRLLMAVSLPPTEEERRILAASRASAEEEEIEIEDSLDPMLIAELEEIEAEIDQELATSREAAPTEEIERQEQLDALVMTQARGIGALLGFAQNTIRPQWIRAKAMQEIVRHEHGNEATLCVGTFRFGPESVHADAPRIVDTDGLFLEKDANEIVHAECLTRRDGSGYSLTMDLASQQKTPTLTPNALLHVSLFDRESGSAFKRATVKLEKHGDTLHGDLFAQENLSKADLERADALFWVEPAEEAEPDDN